MKKVIVFLALALPAFAQFGNASRIQGRSVTSTAPSDTNVICWDASAAAWKPCASGGSPSGAAGGDLSGTFPNPTVAKIQGAAVKTPLNCSNAYVLTWVTANSRFECLAAAGGSVTITGSATSNAVMKGNSGSDIKASGCTIDSNDVINCPGGATFGNTATGYTQWSGLTSGYGGFSVPDVAGTSILYLLPTSLGATGSALEDSGSTTCPTLPAGAPSTCHQLAWNSVSGATGTSGAPLFVQTASATVTGNSETTLVGSGVGSTTIPANWFTAAGTTMDVCASGLLTTGAVPGTIRFKLKFGSTVITDTGAFTPLVSTTNGVYDTCVRLTARTVGASGTIMASNILPMTGATLTPGEQTFANPTAGTAVVVDTTATQVIDFTVTFSLAATNSITSTNFYAVGPGSAVSSVNGLSGAVTLNTGPYIPQAGTGATQTATIPTSGWTIVNGALVNDFFTSYIAMSILDNGSTNWRFYTRTNSGSSYTTYAVLGVDPTNISVDGQVCGVYISDGTKYEGIELLSQGSSGPNRVQVRTISNTTSGGTVISGPANNVSAAGMLAIKIVDNGSTRVWSYWTAGAWVQQLSESTHTFLTETKAGFGGLSGTGNAAAVEKCNLLFWSQQ